jgi:hypothetical protein
LKYKAGELVKYMSRILVVLRCDPEWLIAVEVGTTNQGKYSYKAVKSLNKKPAISR